MADLWDRLRAARDRTPGETPREVPPAAPAEAEFAPEGWRWVAPLVAERTLVFDLDPDFLAALTPTVDWKEWDRVLCLDTETTGLSGGAGTVAFLVGWARLVPNPAGLAPQVEVRQWFLRDHPGEPEMIEAIHHALEEARTLVSFNGASFDLPLLKSRWALAGRAFPEIPHRDDLHFSRRLWKRLLDSCRLSRIEETVLGIHRDDDVPGSLVPELWFAYLRQGAEPDFAGPLEGVLRHHAQDVYSLLCLDLLLLSLRQSPSAIRWKETFGPYPEGNLSGRPAGFGLFHPNLGEETAVDFWGLAALKSQAERDQSLESAWDGRPDEALGLAWADRLKRQGDVRARYIWTQLWEEQRSYPALEELLKWLEHREKTSVARGEALERITEALEAPFLPRLWRESLEKRRNRLVRKS
jgi:uncharacterized protein YprB with RNaseH-like and TPR domain